jgi:hypothetical protein
MLSLPLALNVIFAVIALELIVLSVWLVRRSRAALIAPLVTFLASGALLMAGLRIAIGGGDQAVLILSLIALSFPAHLATLILVWRAVTKP